MDQSNSIATLPTASSSVQKIRKLNVKKSDVSEDIIEKAIRISNEAMDVHTIEKYDETFSIIIDMDHQLEWTNINFSLKLGKAGDLCGRTETKSILKNVSGKVKAGYVCAILGPSGSGKTCLLNALSGRVHVPSMLKPNLSGEIHLNGHKIDPVDLRDKVAYVGQEDYLFSYLTVEETLLLSAYFNVPTLTSKAEVYDKVESMINKLGLEKVKNTVIGSVTRRGISGGEKKRVAIGKELLADPLIFFLDEPTSGLDSFQALAVSQTLGKAAKSGKIVISVIHQPSSAIFSTFDYLIILANGQVMYAGLQSTVLDYFGPKGLNCPPMYNPADYLLEIASIDTTNDDSKRSTSSRVNLLLKSWHANDSVFEDTKQNEILLGPHTNLTSVVYPSATMSRGLKSYFTPAYFWRELRNFKVLQWRALVQVFRNFFGITVRAATLIFFAAILSLVFRKLGHNQKSIQDRMGIIFFVTSNQSFGPLINALNTFPDEKEIVRREQTGKAYSVLSYFVSRVLAEWPLQIIVPLVYGTIVYWSVNLNADYLRYLTFLCIIVVEGLCALALGLAISALAPTVLIANALGPPILVVLIIFGGFYINSASLPVGSRWLQYVSYVRWTFQGLAINEFAGTTFTCDFDSLACIKSGDDQLKRLTFSGTSVWYCVELLVALLVGYLVVAYIILILTAPRYVRISPNKDKFEDPGMVLRIESIANEIGRPLLESGSHESKFDEEEEEG